MDREIADSFLKLTNNLLKAMLLSCFPPSLLIPQIQAQNARAKSVNQSTDETNLSTKHPKTRPDSLLGPARRAPGTGPVPKTERRERGRRRHLDPAT